MSLTADARSLLGSRRLEAVDPARAAHVPAPRREPPFLLRMAVPTVDACVLVLAVALSGAWFRLDSGVVGYVLLAFATLAFTGTQRARINPRLGDDMAGLLGRVAVPFLPVALLADPGRTARVAVLAAFLIPAGRLVSYAIVRLSRKRGVFQENTLLIGAGEVGVEVATMLKEHQEFGLVPVGFLDAFDDTDLPLPILGDASRLHEVIDSHGVRRVIVAFGFAPDPEVVRLLRALATEEVEVHVVPRFFELGVNARTAFNDDLWGIPLVRLRRAALRSTAQRVKRCFDLGVSVAVLAVAWPVLLACAAAVRLSSPGPILFRQKRVGQHGRVVEVLKFRTMRVNDDSDTRWGVANRDSRVTKVGAFMRASSLDELPQIFNVLSGEMSLVGPRPERPMFAEKFAVEVPRYDDRHRVPVGITGWAQVHGLRGDTPIKERARFDNSYIENWSPWQDVRILARTFLSVVSHRGR